MNSRSATTSPIPRSFSRRSANSGARIPATLFLGDSTVVMSSEVETSHGHSRQQRIRDSSASLGMTRSAAPNLPILHQLARYLFEKTGGPLEDVAEAGVQTHVRVAKIKLVTRARDRDVKKAALFLDGVARFQRAAAREHAVGEPDDKDGVELQAFGLMHGRKVYRLVVSGRVRRRLGIDIGNERELGEEFLHIAELPREGGELIQVFAPHFVISEVGFGIIVVDRFHHRY